MLSKDLVLACKLGKAWLNHEPGLDSNSRKGSLTRTNAQRMIRYLYLSKIQLIFSSVKKVPHSDKHHYQAETALEKCSGALRDIKLSEIKPNEHFINALTNSSKSMRMSNVTEDSENFRALKERLETTTLASIAREIKFLKSAVNQLIATENYLSKYVLPDYSAVFFVSKNCYHLLTCRWEALLSLFTLELSDC